MIPQLETTTEAGGELHADAPGTRLRRDPPPSRPPLQASDVVAVAPLLVMVPVGAAALHLALRPRAWSPAARWVLGIAATLGGLNLVRWQVTRHLTPGPEYRSLGHHGALELREYPALVMAETLVGAELDTALEEGFRRLAGYIGGDNHAGERLGMTTPVLTRREDLPMTAPVTNLPVSGGHSVLFVMPPGRRVDDLPGPTDVRVQLRAQPARRLAALRFTGLASPERVEDLKGTLVSLVGQLGLATEGEPLLARYDGPGTLPFLRRNEVWVEVRTPAASQG